MGIATHTDEKLFGVHERSAGRWWKTAIERM